MKAKKIHISAKRLREVLHYDPLTGEWKWLANRCRTCIGKRAGWIGGDGRRRIDIDGEKYLAARLAWLYMLGKQPPSIIDHHDTNQINDKWENLRPADKSLNAANMRLSKRNTSGRKGVTWEQRTLKWVAQISCRGAHIHIGSFDSVEGASAAYECKARELFGEFARA